ncbi:hypothetical protein AMTR_s00020p00029440 [Amborella trichopoda]|uniref:Uncharacterized protein n=1 Tax=Amborella trichopoda TaxID=13333 RepID=W1PUS9_AMBTC|nr:hypothetical protein AMTR_s00020p00029440 [Amborella trichopoda]
MPPPKEPGDARKILTMATFFTKGNPFPVGGPSDKVFLDGFGKSLDRPTMDTGEAMYLASVRGCILTYRGISDKKLEGDVAPLYPSTFGRQGGLHDPEAPVTSREAWTNLHMRTAWETCLDLSSLNWFVIPHYGHLGHVIDEYRQ